VVASGPASTPRKAPSEFVTCEEDFPALFRLQMRCLGCHFASDDENNLGIVGDVSPALHNIDGLLCIFEHVSVVGDVSLELCEEVLRTGRAAR